MSPLRTELPIASETSESVLKLLAVYELGRDEGKWVTPEQFEDAHPELFEVITQEERTSFLEAATPVGERAWSIDGVYPEWAPSGKFGRYTLTERLGKGGGGEVWRAHDERMERPVAIKRVNKDALAEAKRLAKVKHRNICTVYDVDKGRRVIAMELLEGGSLREKIGTLRIKQIAAIVCKVAEALRAVHKAGLVHRDVKPENILFSSEIDSQEGVYSKGDGERFGDLVKLADFSHSSDESITEGATSIGTSPYKAPEARKGSKHSTLTAKADGFSLGVVLYELLTSQWPFGEGGYRKNYPVPLKPHVLNPCCPFILSELCMHMLSPEPDDRPELGVFGGYYLDDGDLHQVGVIHELSLIQRETSWEDHHNWANAGGNDFSPLRSELRDSFPPQSKEHWTEREEIYWQMKPIVEKEHLRLSRGEELEFIPKKRRKKLRHHLSAFLDLNRDPNLAQGAIRILVGIGGPLVWEELARRHLEGDGVGKDVEVGIGFLKSAADGGSESAMEDYGGRLNSGNDVERDPEKGEKYLQDLHDLQTKKTALSNRPVAFEELLSRLDEFVCDEGHSEIETTALREYLWHFQEPRERWKTILLERGVRGSDLRKQTEAGPPGSMGLRKGERVMKGVLAKHLLEDSSLAPRFAADGRKLLWDTAEEGDPVSQFELGVLLLEGRGFERDLAKGISLLQQAGDTGHGAARKRFKKRGRKVHFCLRIVGVLMAASVILILGSGLEWWPWSVGLAGFLGVGPAFLWVRSLQPQMRALEGGLMSEESIQNEPARRKSRSVAFKAYAEGIYNRKWTLFKEFEAACPDLLEKLLPKDVDTLRVDASKSIILNNEAVNNGLLPEHVEDVEHRRLLEELT